IQVQKNQGRQSTYRVFTLDDKPELLVRPTSQEVAASVRQNDTTTSDKMSSVPVTKCHGGSDKMSPVLELLLDKTLDDNIIDKSKETELNEDIKGDDFLSMNESDLDSEATKETSKQDKEISDVTVISDQKDTQCHAAGDDELELFDDYLDEDLEREKELKCEQYKAEKKKRF
ncbi:helix-turn-helix domain-containing protein, partial [Escherichia coli]